MDSGPYSYSAEESGFESGSDPFTPCTFFGRNKKTTNYET